VSAAEALELAGRVEQACSQALGALAAVILHGSLVLGDFVPSRSDVDLLVVAGEELTDDQRAALVAAMPDSAWVDLRVVTRTVASSPTPAPPLDTSVTLQAGRAPLLEAQNPGERDLVVEFATCRTHGRSLRGAEPGAVLGAVPDEWVLDVGEAQLADWQRLEFSPPHAELMVFTACRVWRFAEERCHCSKTAAAEWALAQEPSLHVVRAALRRRHDDPSFPIEEPLVRELLARVRRHSLEISLRRARTSVS
jgi:predicted nucleotidyltransferase